MKKIVSLIVILTYLIISASIASAANGYPITLYYQIDSAGGVFLSWESTLKPNTFDGYSVYRCNNKADTAGIDLLPGLVVISNYYTDNTAVAGKTYYYYVGAFTGSKWETSELLEVSVPARTVAVAPIKKTITPITFPNDTNGKNLILLQINNPNMVLNGKTLEIDPGKSTSPVLISKRTMIPIRALIENMGGVVSWDGDTRKITLTLGYTTIEMQLGNTAFYVNGAAKQLDVAPTTINGRTILPVRFVAENLSCGVDWDGTTQGIYITYGSKINATAKAGKNITATLTCKNPKTTIDPTITQTINFSDEVLLTIPAGSTPQTEEVFIYPMTTDNIDKSKLIPYAIYDISIGNQKTFNKELTIEIPYDFSKLNSDYSAESRVIAGYLDETTQKWMYMPYELDKVNNIVRIKTTHLCGIGVYTSDSNALGDYLGETYGNSKTIEENIKQAIISDATSAYNSTTGAAGAAYTSAKSTIANAYANANWDTLSSYFQNAEISTIYSEGAVYREGRFYIYYNPYDTDKLETSAGGFFTSNITNTNMPTIVYGDNFYFVKDKLPLATAPWTKQGFIPPPKYIQELALYLRESEARYKTAGITPPTQDLMVIAYKTDSGVDKYNKLNDIMYITLNAKSSAELRANTSHELLHNYQANSLGISFLFTNLWLAEATAEYASIAIASQSTIESQRPMQENFFNVSLTSSPLPLVSLVIETPYDDHYYESAHFIKFLASTHKLNLGDLFRYMISSKSTLSKPETIIESYLQTIKDPDYLFENLYAEFTADVLFGTSTLLPNVNAFTGAYNKAETKYYIVGADYVYNSALAIGAYMTGVYGVSAYVPAGHTRMFDISAKAYNDQTIHVYLSNAAGKGLATPLLVVKPNTTGTITQTLTSTSVIYFISSSKTEIVGVIQADNNDASLDNIKIVEKKSIIGNSNLTEVNLEITGYSSTGFRFDWDLGDGTTQSTNTNKIYHKYDYTFKDATGSGPFSENLVIDSKTYKVSVKVFLAADGKLIETIASDVTITPIKTVP